MRILSSVALLLATASSDDRFYTGFHAQPLHNWLNDPNGPMFFNGNYHLFFQYNPNDYNWGDMHWYHMVSKDMVHWEHLPVALAPDHDYDCGGIFSGSATIVRNETTGEDVPVLSYSVACGKDIINAVPADLSDPKLVEWTKPSYNPVIPMPSDASGGFRDPTTSWQGKDGVWRMLVGCVNSACQFKSTNFIDWTYVGKLHSHGSGMWECPDFYKLPDSDSWLFKASINGDWWTVGTYEEVSDPSKPDKFTPTSQGDILENQQKYDWGTFYASKGFHTPDGRYVNFGWVNYHCDGTDWSGVQTLPRSVTVDQADPTRILTNPISELEALRLDSHEEKSVVIKAGSSYPVNFGGTQLDVEVSFSASQGGLSGSFGVRSLVATSSTPSEGLDSWESGWDLMGDDYAILTDSDLIGGCTGDGACPCQARCEADGPDQCKAWTLVGSTFDQGGARCALKSSIPTPKEHPGGDIISGVARLYNGWDLPGSDYSTITDASVTGDASGKACQALCSNDGSCAAWTLVLDGFDSRGARCCLKNSVPGAVQHTGEGIVSGVEPTHSSSSGGVPMTITMQDTGASLEGQPFSVDAGNPVSMRVLVDASIVEAYAQGGRAVTTRTYCPTSDDSSGLEVFNSGSEDIVVDITVHRMDTANVKPSSVMLV
jgi:sucrose-6-phosphate hydrolase SacC (GH32 family)